MPIPCSKTRLRWSSSWFVHARLGRAAGLGGLRGELRDRARRPACRPHFRRRGCGMLIRTPTQARQKVADDVDRVRREFVVNDKRLHRWQRWLDDDSSWPDFSVVVHGDLYVGHVLIDNTERVSGMIDWSEARVDDPAIDMAAHLMVFGEEGSRSSSSRMKRPVAGCGRGSPTTSRSALRSGRSPTHSSPSTRVTKSTSLRRRRSSPQRNERTSI
ncbi:phosphotransferase [Salmonella enterica subsp. enterica serovar Worthington]|nr:phosphotransferase [Salmonella enterica subsp. enterica serovar Worthington]